MSFIEQEICTVKSIKICYIILTCEPYLETRVKWQNDTFLKSVDKADVYFISCKNKEPNIYGWNTPDNYEACPIKYIKFFKNMLIDYDWYCFIDDDTFLNIKNLHNLLQKYNSEESLYIGSSCRGYNPPFYMSGGAGFVLSKSLYLKLLNFIRNTEDNILLQSIYGDLSVGLWIKNIENVIFCNNNNFHPVKHSNENELQDFISFHYLKSFEDFEFYNKFV